MSDSDRQKLTSMPRLSIGMPVYNGERYLEEAVNSILDQTFTDFELIICDNASSDQTESIARRLVAQDSRIKYHRNPENLGAAPNFNYVAELAVGEYFKWAAHDDLCASDYLERCIEVLDSQPDVVIAFSKTMIIGADSEPIEAYDWDLRADVYDAPHRMRAVMAGHKCFEIFGVIRREALIQTPLIGSFAHGDGILLAELSLHGRFVEIDAHLFFARRHPEQSMAMLGDYRRYAVWFNPRLRGKILFPHWRMYFEHMRSVFRISLPAWQRFRCLLVVARITFGRRRALWRDVHHQWRRLVSRLLGRTSISRISFESMVERIQSAFKEQPDQPSEIRRISGVAGEDDMIELSFSSPKVGALYMQQISRLSYATEWSIRIAEKTDSRYSRADDRYSNRKKSHSEINDGDPVDCASRQGE